MTDAIKLELSAAGVQVDDALLRFMGNDAMLERFLKKFPDDQTYGTLCRALEDGDLEEAFRAAHTLKGVCGNLSMARLFHLFGEQTECLRGGDLAGANAMMPQIAREYEDLCGVIRRCLD